MSDGNLTAKLIACSEGSPELPEEVIVELCNSENELAAWYACKAVGALGIVEGIGALLRVLNEPRTKIGENEADKRLISAWSLGRLGFDAAGDRLQSEYENASTLKKEGIVDALGEMRDVRALPLLSKAIEEEPYDVVLWATLAASKIGDGAKPILVDLLEREDRGDRKILLQDAIEKIDASAS